MTLDEHQAFAVYLLANNLHGDLPMYDDLSKLSLDQLHDKKTFNRLCMALGMTNHTPAERFDFNDRLLVEINQRLTAAPQFIR